MLDIVNGEYSSTASAFGSNNITTRPYWLSYVEVDNRFYTLKTWAYFNRKRQFEATANTMIRSVLRMD
ncbi:MAG: hypothetical protein QNK23_03570 [Crocinitomicaceae bacterium]|nr:hypothetical protein [Crocinitomicaceae bacterium]